MTLAAEGTLKPGRREVPRPSTRSQRIGYCTFSLRSSASGSSSGMSKCAKYTHI